MSKNVISMAWTGIAAILLSKGMTSHKTFRLPLDLSTVETSFLKYEKDKRKLREADIIIWDEASMIPKKALEIIDSTLRDLCKCEIPFGNKTIVLGGDFRQILPVKKINGNRFSIVEDTIKYSKLWNLFKILKLEKNVRSSEEKFSKFLLQIGDGSINPFVIPSAWKTKNICEKIYFDMTNKMIFENSVILACHNEDIFKLNNQIIKMMKEREKVYYSTDYATYKGVDQIETDIHLNFPLETLHDVKNEGLPPHKLILKIGCIIMLIRNISVNDGLCNGTRLKIKNLFKCNIEAEIITGDKMGNIVFIPRITMSTNECSNLPFILYRKQFPIILAFAITINKSQGQTFDKIGLYYRRPLFSHGQLYVALSRCKNKNCIFIQNDSKNEDIENIV